MNVFIKIVFCFFILTLSLQSSGQNPDCKKFKNGKFILRTPNAPDYIIIRKGKFQKEKKDGDDSYFTFHVKWIDDCTYVLTMTEETRKKHPELPPDTTVTVTIIRTTNDTYTQNSSSNISDRVVSGTLKKIK